MGSREKGVYQALYRLVHSVVIVNVAEPSGGEHREESLSQIFLLKLILLSLIEHQEICLCVAEFGKPTGP